MKKVRDGWSVRAKLSGAVVQIGNAAGFKRGTKDDKKL